MIIRLDKYVSESAAVSRQDAKKMITQGVVCVKGQVVKKSDFKVDTQDIVSLNGNPLQYHQFVYIMLNKPYGVVSASEDGKDITVVDLVKKAYPKRNLFPAGRLDKTSTGFILLTDDGAFAHQILAPKHHVPKEYIVTLDKDVTEEVVRGFKEGVTLVDGTVLKSAELYKTAQANVVNVVLHQGVYHQIKRMFGVFDIGVNQLHRIRMGNLYLDHDLDFGEFRDLTLTELSQISNIMNSQFTEC